MDVRLLFAIAAVASLTSVCDGNRNDNLQNAEQCTVEQMDGYDVIGYAAARVFRFRYEEGKAINLLVTFDVVTNGMVDVVEANDFHGLLHLHQGFNGQLKLLFYGSRRIDKVQFSGPDREAVRFDLSIDPSFKKQYYTHLMNSSSVQSVESIPMYGERKVVWKVKDFTRNQTDVNTFTSFAHDSKIYFEGGHASFGVGNSFVPHSQDICNGIEFPAVDIAFYPPQCYNRKLDGRIADDEWIVAVVNGTLSTRSQSEKLCSELHSRLLGVDNDQFLLMFGEEYMKGLRRNILIPRKDLYCYYMRTPEMEKPCLFAYGNKYIFQDVQVLPKKPICQPVELPTTTTTMNPFCISRADLDFNEKFEVFEYVQDCIVRHTSLSSAIASEKPHLEDCTSQNYPVEEANFLPFNDSVMIMISGSFNNGSWQSGCTVLEMPNRGDHVPVKQRNTTGFISAKGTNLDFLRHKDKVLLFKALPEPESRTVGFEILHEEGLCWVTEALRTNYNVSAEPFSSLIENRTKFAKLKVKGMVGDYGWIRVVGGGIRIYEHPRCSPFPINLADPNRRLFIVPRFEKPRDDSADANADQCEELETGAASLSANWILSLWFSSVLYIYFFCLLM